MWKQLLAASLLIVACSGCGDSHDKLAGDWIAIMSDHVAAFEGLDSPQKIEAAATRMEKLIPKLEAMAKRDQALGELKPEQVKALVGRHEKEIKQLQDRMMDLVMDLWDKQSKGAISVSPETTQRFADLNKQLAEIQGKMSLPKQLMAAIGDESTQTAEGYDKLVTDWLALRNEQASILESMRSPSGVAPGITRLEGLVPRIEALVTQENGLGTVTDQAGLALAGKYTAQVEAAEQRWAVALVGMAQVPEQAAKFNTATERVNAAYKKLTLPRRLLGHLSRTTEERLADIRAKGGKPSQSGNPPVSNPAAGSSTASHPVDAQAQAIIDKHGKDNVATVRVLNVPQNLSFKVFDLLRAALDSDNVGSSGSGAGTTITMVLARVTDLDAFAKKLNVGQVLSVDKQQRTITVIADEAKIAAATPGSPAASPASSRPGTSSRPATTPSPSSVASSQPASTQPATTPSTLPNTTAPSSTPANVASPTPPAAKKGELLPAPAGWEVKVDPPGNLLPIDPKKVAINVPPMASAADLLFPATASTFVALGGNMQQTRTREIWDLAAAAKTGTVKGVTLSANAKLALSPDGKYFAASESGTPKPVIGVWDTKANKGLVQIAVSDRLSAVEFLEFAAADRLVASEGSGQIRIWELPSGKALPPIAMDAKGAGAKLSKANTAISPGGGYLVASDGQKAVVYDLKAGKKAGELQIKAANGFPNSLGWAFSPDGAELAGLFEWFDSQTLFNFDVSTGRMLVNLPFDGKWKSSVPATTKYPHRPLEWFTDKSAWLVMGHAVIDRKSDSLAWVAPSNSLGSAVPRRMIGPDHLLVLGGTPDKMQLITAEVPKEQFGQVAVAPSATTGAPAVTTPATPAEDESKLPPIAHVDASGVAAISLLSVPWSAQPDPPPARGKLSTAISLQGNEGRVKGVRFSQGPAPQAAVWYEIGRPGARPPRGNQPAAAEVMPLRVDRYDLANGKLLKTLRFPVEGEVLALSADGTNLVTRVGKEHDRLDIWVSDTGNHLVGFRPFTGNWAEKAVKTAAFIGPSRLLTHSGKRELVVWSIPDGKPVYRLENIDSVQLSPGGKLLLLGASQKLFLANAENGVSVGEVPQSALGAAGFSADGQRLAQTTMGDDAKCLVWDMKTGELQANFDLPRGGMTRLEWCGPEQLLLDDTWLVDLKAQGIVWNYKLPVGSHAADSLDGRHWFLAARGAFDTAVALTGMPLPEPQVASKIASATVADESVVKPGSAVAVQVSLGGGPADKPNFPQDVEKRAKDELKRNGMQVADSSPIVFNVTCSMTSTGKNQEFRSIGLGGGNISIALTELVCELTFVVDGKPVWKRQAKYGNGSYFVTLPKDEDLATYLEKRQWSAGGGYLLNFRLPQRIFPNDAGQGFGSSMLVPGGTQIVQ